jgi:hypothetical protein
MLGRFMDAGSHSKVRNLKEIDCSASFVALEVGA